MASKLTMKAELIPPRLNELLGRAGATQSQGTLPSCPLPVCLLMMFLLELDDADPPVAFDVRLLHL